MCYITAVMGGLYNNLGNDDEVCAKEEYCMQDLLGRLYI